MKNKNIREDYLIRAVGLPLGWEVVHVKDIADVVRGASPRPAGSPLYFDGDYLPWITVSEVTANDDMFLYETKTKLTEEGAKYTRVIEPGTLLLTNSGATLGVPKISKIKAGANDGVAMLINLRRIYDRYFYYYLQSKTQHLRDVIAPGNGQPNLNTELIGGIVVSLPPLQEQIAIFEILEAWGKAIATAEHLLANSLRAKEGLVHLLLSNSRQKRQGGKILQKARASQIFAQKSIRNNVGLPLLSVMQDVGVVPRDSLARKVVMPDGATDGYKRIDSGDFVISLRSFEGGLEYCRYTGLVSPAYIVLKSKKKIDDDFYRHYFKSREFISRLAVAVIGIRDGKQISYDDFAFLKIPSPPIAEQVRIAGILNQAEAVIQVQRSHVEHLRKEKQALMQQLLTGKRRVRLADAATTAPKTTSAKATVKTPVGKKAAVKKASAKTPIAKDKRS